VIHHHYKLTRARDGRARIPQATRGGSTGLPGRSRHVTCGNNEDGEPGPGHTQGRTAGSPQHGASSSAKHSDSLPLLLASPPHRSRSPVNRPDDLATELNPHKTELNPHEAVPGS
jgi:hypothetical protein